MDADNERIYDLVYKVPFEGLLGGMLKFGILTLCSYGSVWRAASEVLALAIDRKEALKDFYLGVKFKNKEINQLREILNYFNLPPQLEGLNATDLAVKILESVVKSSDVRDRLERDLIKSLSTVEIGKNHVILGVIPREGSKPSYGLFPNTFKQPEFHEHRYAYMTPSASVSGKTQIYADPIWFFVLSLGYLMTFVGRLGLTTYYLVPDVNTMLARYVGPEEVLISIKNFTYISDSSLRVIKRGQHAYSHKELFELIVSYELAKEYVEIPKDVSFSFYIVDRVGQAYIVKEIFDVDIVDVFEYFKRLIDLLEDSKMEDPYRFIESLFSEAYRELERRRHDVSVVALPLLRSLYTAIKARDYRILVNSLYEFQRVNHARGKGALSEEQLEVLVKVLQELTQT